MAEEAVAAPGVPALVLEAQVGQVERREEEVPLVRAASGILAGSLPDPVEVLLALVGRAWAAVLVGVESEAEPGLGSVARAVLEVPSPAAEE